MNSLYFAELDAHLHYHDLPGADPAIVFLHGLGGASSANFPRVARHPALVHHRAILVDLFGFGYSDAPVDFDYSLPEHAATVAHLLDRLSIRDCLLFGYSMGGSIAIVLAAGRPDLVSRLVVAEGNLDPGEGSISVMIARQPEQVYLNGGHEALLRRFRKRPETYAPARHASPLGMYRSARGLYEGTRPTMRQLFFNLTVPKAYLFGAHSLPNAAADRIAASGVPVLVVPKTGHLMPDENPDGLAEAIALGFRGG